MVSDGWLVDDRHFQLRSLLMSTQRHLKLMTLCPAVTMIVLELCTFIVVRFAHIDMEIVVLVPSHQGSAILSVGHRIFAGGRANNNPVVNKHNDSDMGTAV